MNRNTPLKRTTPLKAKTELKQGKPLERKTPMPRGNGFKREANPPKQKASRQKTAPKTVVDLIKDRSEGLCEIGLKCFGRAQAVESAHRRGKGSGGVGPKNSTSNVASNLLRGCAEDHALIDNAQVADAERLGLKLRHTKAHPYEMPVQHYRLGWVLLDDQGSHRPAPERACRPGDLWPVITVGPWDLLTGGGAIREALDRFGHGDCYGWSGERDGLLVCGCGMPVFVAEEVA